jgi:glyoxylase-like metal-dependent hydrolase (beta-lactamase superfamily II)
MSVSVSVGSATVIALSDTVQQYGATSVYPDVNEAAWEPYRSMLTGNGELVLNFGCFVVQADGRTVLVDTGWGPTFNGRLMDELSSANVSPDSIDAVIFTHLHGDHIGWNITEEGGEPRPRFPRARYLVPEADWKHYTGQAEQSDLFRQQMLPLDQLGVMDLVGGDHALSPSVTTVATPGHTPGHLCIAITSGGEHGFILGDVAITPVEAHETGWKNSFDGDSEMARGTRERVLERLERDRALVGASHFPLPGLGRFTRDSGGRRVWQPL